MTGGWLTWMTELGRGVLDLVLPAHCLTCGRPLTGQEKSLCDPCQLELFTDSHPACPRCAATVGPYGTPDGRCPNCRDEPLPFDAVLRLGVYDGLLRQVVLRLKDQRGEGLAELLGERWGDRQRDRFRALGLEVIVPVPLHIGRWLVRGYNQSAAVARGLARQLRVPCEWRSLRRVRATARQTSQNMTGRRDNVRGAFAPGRRAAVAGRCVLLVDDVMTTGATAAEAARALRAAGAARVVIAALARAAL